MDIPRKVIELVYQEGYGMGWLSYETVVKKLPENSIALHAIEHLDFKGALQKTQERTYILL
ncbi:hypothetical protein BIY37_06705 [Candidatus Brocadia sapporoensis]|uniref:Uncharacterized protein n=1 Tax=Candidatus Brocadia sapporoensis TaxID=392547 RepID=A0A1V6M0D5_9BACT|nr:hypothetical protein BIY37_06705 [Candidatus Brocadia sapporoensis]TVL96525.1 MAG: hypothetical protein CV082_06845 [Candidatus Brocadia sp. BL1]GJQ24585.1 MAG: hypothetical protein HBSAPP01_23750 [Candidatus Brocadia sapporoensis]